MPTEPQPQSTLPTRPQALAFAAKASLLQARRALQDARSGPRRLERDAAARCGHLAASSVTPLWTERSDVEAAMQFGKVENLRRALSAIDGVVLAPGQVFSFWRHVGRPTRGRGFVDGRQLREGCIYPAVGGGLCQLSNALYDAALTAGLEIVERHAHSMAVPGSAAARDRDATVAWNYVDLRFRAAQATLLRARLTATDLVVEVWTDGPRNAASAARLKLEPLQPTVTTAHACTTCGEAGCFRHRAAQSTASLAGRTAWIVDEWRPEFEAHAAAARRATDILSVPVHPARARGRGWSASGWREVRACTALAAIHGLRSRRLARYGARRLQAQLARSEAIAGRLLHRMPPDVSHICVAQSLLPWAWRLGALGGRTYDVLMTRMPLHALHALLDAELARHPDRATLGEYRAPAAVVEAEREGLAGAARLITPHAGVAAAMGDRAQLLPWHLPRHAGTARGRWIAFPGPTAARKGAYELREAARAAGLPVRLLGAELEGAGFWDGVECERWLGGGDWLEGIAAVVQPALVEDNPRRLLLAIASGVPVIATEACGLGDLPGVRVVPFGDTEALAAALQEVFDMVLEAPAHS